jgi:proline racemase
VIVLETLDAHVAGATVRWLTGGFPAPAGKTMRAKCRSAARQADDLRRALTIEPRGHRDMLAAVLTEPVSPGADAGVLFMSADGWEPASGHAVMGLAAMALDRGAIVPAAAGRSLLFDTVGGRIRATVAPGTADSNAFEVRLEGEPAFVVHGGVTIALPARRVRVDLAFAGMFHAVADGEAVGVPLDAAHVPELRRTAIDLARTVNASIPLTHPLDGEPAGVEAVIFTSPARSEQAALRVVMVTSAGRLDPSPSATGMSSVLSIIDQMGLLEEAGPFVCEGMAGTLLSATVKGRTRVGDLPALIPEVSGRGWVTGEHRFFVAPDDPSRFGLQLSS